MTQSSQPAASDLVSRVFTQLYSRRYLLYLGCLGAVVFTRMLAPAWTRTPVFVVALTVMCTTYFAELHSRTQAVRAESVVVTLAVAGIALGAYLVAEVSAVGGGLFVLGGILFFRAATRTSQHD